MSKNSTITIISVDECTGGASIKFDREVDGASEWNLIFPGLTGTLYKLLKDGLVENPTFEYCDPLVFTTGGKRTSKDRVSFSRLNILRALKVNATNQRPLTASNVKRFVQIHKEGQWGHSSDRVTFREGKLVNGQHRCFSCLVCGSDAIFDILLDATEEDIARQDGQTPRKKYDNASMLGKIDVDYDKLPPRGILWPALSLIFELKHKHQPNTDQDTADIFNEFKDALEFLARLYKSKTASNKQIIHESSVLAAMLIAYKKYSERVYDPFYSITIPNVSEELNDPLKRLFDYLNRNGGKSAVIKRELESKAKEDKVRKERNEEPSSSAKHRIVFRVLTALRLHLEGKTIAQSHQIKCSPDIMVHYK
jgi:hypothetical protein